MVDGTALTFEVLGLLKDVFTMVDRQTGTVWQHLDGSAVRGPLKGRRLEIVPLQLSYWGEWRRSHPDTVVLSPDTPFSNRYRDVTTARFDFREATFGDERMRSNTLVVGVEVDGRFKGYPVDKVRASGGVVNDTLAGAEILIVYDADAQTGLAYSRELGGRTLSFRNAAPNGFELTDVETGSEWDIQGRATSGTLAGETLIFVPSFISEWSGWSGYHPETLLYSSGP